MIRFRIFSLPRCGSSWASVLFSSSAVPCIHDPIEYCRTLEAYQAMGSRGDIGISCTGGWLLDGWDERTPTILLQRPIAEVQRSSVRLGLPEIPDVLLDRWESLPWPRFTLDELKGEGVHDIWQYLRPWEVFPKRRHAELVKLKIEPTDTEIAKTLLALKNSLSEVA